MPKNAAYAIVTLRIISYFSACVVVRNCHPCMRNNLNAFGLEIYLVRVWYFFVKKNNRPANHLRSTVIFFIHGGKNYTQALTVSNRIANLNVKLKPWAQSRMTVLKIWTTAEISSTGKFCMAKDSNYGSIAELNTFTSMYILKD